jgi:hypothetical protein
MPDNPANKPIKLGIPLLTAEERAQAEDHRVSSLFSSRNSDANAFKQEIKLCVGLTAYAVGFLIAGSSFYWREEGAGQGTDELAYRDEVATWLRALYALLQTGGLLVMTTADLDVNFYFRSRKISATVFAGSVMLLSGLSALQPPIVAMSQVWWLSSLPFLYMLFRFNSVLDMHPGFFRFTELFALSLAFILLGNGMYYLILSCITPQKALRNSHIVIGSAYCGCTLAMLLMYRARRHAGDSLTLALNSAVFVQLLCLGATDLLLRVLETFFAEPFDAGDAANLKRRPGYTTFTRLLFGMIHIVPTVCFIQYRQQLQRWMGRRWLVKRKGARRDLRASLLQTRELLETRGNIVEVETAIAEQADLNAFAFFMADDGFTLLHLAVLNEHYDSVQRLLQTGEVYANKPSKYKGRTALFLAAELGE